MSVPDVTTASSEWEQVRDSSHDDPLWKNTVHENVYSTDGGKTFTIATERVAPDIPREVRQSRKV